MFSKFMKIENFILYTPNKIIKMEPQKTPKQKLKEIENHLVEVITSMGHLKGRSDKMAKIAAYITIRREATQKVLRKTTGYSLGTVSSILQTLEKMGFVTKKRSKNSREYIYKYEESYTQTQSKSMMNVFEYLSIIQKFLTQIEDLLNQPQLKGKEGYEDIKDFVETMGRLFPAVKQALTKFSGLDEKRGLSSK